MRDATIFRCPGGPVRRRLWVALACVLLCACGQSGDLYLPPETPDESSGQ